MFTALLLGSTVAVSAPPKTTLTSTITVTSGETKATYRTVSNRSLTPIESGEAIKLVSESVRREVEMGGEIITDDKKVTRWAIFNSRGMFREAEKGVAINEIVFLVASYFVMPSSSSLAKYSIKYKSSEQPRELTLNYSAQSPRYPSPQLGNASYEFKVEGEVSGLPTFSITGKWTYDERKNAPIRMEFESSNFMFQEGSKATGVIEFSQQI